MGLFPSDPYGWIMKPVQGREEEPEPIFGVFISLAPSCLILFAFNWFFFLVSNSSLTSYYSIAFFSNGLVKKIYPKKVFNGATVSPFCVYLYVFFVVYFTLPMLVGLKILFSQFES